jgi:O-antigen ligase
MLNLLKRTPYLLQVIIIALLFVTPFKVSNELFNGLITAKEFWFLGVVSFILFYGGAHLLFTKQALKINLNLPDILLLAFYAWCYARACFTSFTPILYNHKLQMLTGGLVVYFFIKSLKHGFDSAQPPQKTERFDSLSASQSNNQTIEHSNIPTFKHLIILSFLLSGLIQAVYGLLQLYGYYPSNHNLFKITGSFFNPAPYALYLAVVFPMALGMYLFTLKQSNHIVQTHGRASLSYHTIIQYLSLTTLIAILLVLPATMIRASWLGALVGSLLVLWFAIKQQIISLPRWFKNLFASKTKRIVVISSVLAIIIASSIFLYRIKEGSSIGKSFIWEVTLGKIAEKPLFGHGLGRFEAEYNNWQAEYFQNNPSEMDRLKGLAAGNTKYCFNEFLEIGSEVGIIGLGLLLAMIVVLIIGAVRKLKNERDGYLISYLASFLTLLLISAISYPFYNAPVLVLFFVVMGTISASVGRRFFKPTTSRSFKPATEGGMFSQPILFESWFLKPTICRFINPASTVLKYSTSILLIASSITIAYNQYHKSIAYKNWQEANYAYPVGDFTRANEIYKANFEQLKYEGIFMQQFGKNLQMDGNNKKAIEILLLASKLTSDHVLYCTLGDAYKADKEYTKAENAYLFASSMVPHLLYPHYLLAILYNESGQHKKAIKKANEVLQKGAKIGSIAVLEIKNEMKKILENEKNNEN